MQVYVYSMERVKCLTYQCCSFMVVKLQISTHPFLCFLFVQFMCVLKYFRNSDRCWRLTETGPNSFTQTQVVLCTHRRESSSLCLVKGSRITEKGIAAKQLFSGSLSPKLSNTKCLHYFPLTCVTCCGPESGCFAIVLYSLSFGCTLGIIPSTFT
jgi:hypothetical protein